LEKENGEGSLRNVKLYDSREKICYNNDMENVILDIKKISKSYDEIVALNNFSLSLAKGEVLGLLGPNGAGKTTLISILSGTVKDFSGTVTFKGKNLFTNRQLKNHMGIVPQDMAFYEDLNAMDNLMFWGGLYDVPRARIKQRANELLELVELSGRAKEPIKNFSGGMKRRLNIAIGLIHDPELLLLDEPRLKSVFWTSLKTWASGVRRWYLLPINWPKWKKSVPASLLWIKVVTWRKGP
jgi:ABC-type uncharacterized transport system ATPase subunit